jgi:two-component system chemotaxis response regulator CheY
MKGGTAMKHKILVVDDEKEVRNTIRLQLKGTVFEIIEAEDGSRGIELLGDENVLEVDVIICDVRMPKINGVEAVAYFRRNYPAVPVIVLTGYPDVKLAVEFMKKGVVEYLVKPVEKEKLIESVITAASRHSLFSESVEDLT